MASVDSLPVERHVLREDVKVSRFWGLLLFKAHLLSHY